MSEIKYTFKIHDHSLNKFSKSQYEAMNQLFITCFPNTGELCGTDNAEMDVWFLIFDENSVKPNLIALAYYDGKYMWNFGVGREYQRKGIGKLLFYSVAKWMNSQNRTMEFLVEAKNTRARNFYKSIGAKQVMTYQPESGQNDILMTFKIT